MNTKAIIKTTFLAIFTLVLAIFTSSEAYATTGGPTYVYDFTYNHQDESVYFVEIDESGRGCPPILNKISLNTNTIESVISCDQGEAMRDQSGSYDNEVVVAEIEEITSEFRDLSQIHLSDNEISVDVNFSQDMYLENGDNYLLGKEFLAHIFQGNEKVLEQDIRGCSMDQPFTFAGYSIPGFNEKIVMLVSAVSDCVEGGYTGETLFVVDGVDDLDKSYTTNNYKEPSALVVSEATLTVYESQEVEVTEVEDEDVPVTDENGDSEDNSLPVTTIIALVILGIIGGWLISRKTNTRR